MIVLFVVSLEGLEFARMPVRRLTCVLKSVSRATSVLTGEEETCISEAT